MRHVWPDTILPQWPSLAAPPLSAPPLPHSLHSSLFAPPHTSHTPLNFFSSAHHSLFALPHTPHFSPHNLLSFLHYTTPRPFSFSSHLSLFILLLSLHVTCHLTPHILLSHPYNFHPSPNPSSQTQQPLPAPAIAFFTTQHIPPYTRPLSNAPPHSTPTRQHHNELPSLTLDMAALSFSSHTLFCLVLPFHVFFLSNPSHLVLL